MTVTNITTKGQVTLPKRVRDAMGVKAGAKVSVEFNQGNAVISPVGKVGKSDVRMRLEKVRGTLKDPLSTDEIMQLLRGE
jgi:antitoxin PrlF